ncbi:MAG: mannonate dehydratase [Candidatus Omnitrophica bacterium]|nr:mannonate dehydratase [Candidatus Omnitrophota bacterium]
MKIGLGLYRHMLTPDNFRFAKQAGCTHIVAHMVNYFSDELLHGTDETRNWGISDNQDKLWSEEELCALKKSINDEGLELEAIENFDPSHWYDILLDGPRRNEQIENLKTLIRRLGKAGIPVMGYNFSIAGVWGHVNGPFARGGATSVAFLGSNGPKETPIPRGHIWNMVYNPNAQPGFVEPVTPEQLWRRLEAFLHDVIPVAEEAGVKLAAHPDDPPMPTLRGSARLVNQPALYQKLLDLAPSPSNALEFCLGSLQEMSDGDIYETVDQYSRQNAIAYVHFRNVKGKVPNYYEVFIDEGDIDMIRVLRILRRNGYNGVLIPDHTPQMTCDAPWHAGMAFAIGYMRAALQIMEKENHS